ncbi:MULTISPECIES: hypothetical protein [unclassified Rhizobium]|uniref:hypothetical protein n=1 Tax=unclassified Rhizobium TaxID=2613769 RepID=UPI00288A72B0|nr:MULTISPECIES: hypothetical protein [unclassified Rhizobium]
MKYIVAVVLLMSVNAAHASDWPPASDYINDSQDCAASGDPGNCTYTKTTWPKEYENATSGKYQGQRNVSFCLSTGCNGAIRQNKVLGCAWRFVIVESGHLSADFTDATNLKHYCGRENVDKTERAAAEAQARRILKMLGQ